MIIYMYLHICISSGCDNFHDGLVCWPRTLAGSTAEVDCLENPAVAVALDSVGEIIFYLHSQYEVLAFFSNYVNIEWWRDYCTVSDVTEHAVETERYLANAIISDISK